MTNNKIVGQQKENLLSILNNNLDTKDMKKIESILMKQNIISGSGRQNTCVFTDKQGNEFLPTLSWKPRKEKTKLGEKSSKMVEFINKYNELKTTYLEEVK
tara:strand:+ start:623 stop:925 length:303 start_codon:yes stop_codon:yes gene_type:complete